MASKTPISSLDTLSKDLIPFSPSTQLEDGLDKSLEGSTELYLPGYPGISMSSTSDMYDFIERDICCVKLDRIGDKLYYIAPRSHKAIRPLHRHLLKHQHIIPMEDPDLHLVWRHDKIFLKPLPQYLLSYTFWDNYLLPISTCPETLPSALDLKRDSIVRDALGLLRSYFYLIQHASDFRLALSAGLLPATTTWEEFSRFSARFPSIPDSAVSRRYRYGELGLNRLNQWALTLMGRLWYEDMRSDDADLFAPYYAPLLFAFAMMSLILNAMQVTLTAQQLPSGLQSSWDRFPPIAQWYGLMTMLVCSGVMSTLVFVILGVEYVRIWTNKLKSDN